jgi:hypothetical protein
MKFWIGHWINIEDNTKDRICSINIDVHVTNMTSQTQEHSNFSRNDLLCQPWISYKLLIWDGNPMLTCGVLLVI